MIMPDAVSPKRSDALLAERQHWTAFYKNLLQKNLARAVEYAHDSDRESAQLTNHLDSLLTLLRLARSFPDLHPLAIELIAELHPWPSRWGRWESWEQQIRFAIQICARLDQPNREVIFLDHLTDILHYTGRWDELLTVSKHAMSLAHESQAVLSLVRACSSTVTTLRLLGRNEEAIQTLSETRSTPVIQRAPGSLKTTAMAHLDLQQTDFLRDQGRLQDALSKANEVIVRLKPLPDVDLRFMALAYRTRSLMLWACGEYSAALQDLHQARKLLTKIGDVFADALVSSSLGLVYFSMGELDSAEVALRHSIEISEGMRAYWRLTREIGNLGLIYLLRKDLQQALIHLERQGVLAKRLGATYEVIRMYGNRGIAKFYLKEYGAALRDIEREREFIEKHGRKENLACNYINMSRCHAALGCQASALRLAEQGFDLGRQIGSVALEIIALRCLAEHRSPEQGVQLLHQALELAENRHRRFDEAACLLSLASLTKDEQERDVFWKQGTHLLEKLGAVAWLQGHSSDQLLYLPLII